MSTPAASHTRHSADHFVRRFGATLGILVFLLGIALLGYVFVTARAFFDLPAPTLPATPPANSPAAATAPSAGLVLGQSLAQFLQKLLILLIMCIAGSVVAGRGIQMFFTAITAPHGDTAPSAVPAPAASQTPPPD